MRLILAVLAVAALALAGCSAPKEAKDFRVIPLSDQAKTITLADFKGKVVLLDFWATWCEPCRAAMPEVQEMWDKYHDKGFEVVSITQEDRSTVFAFHKEAPYTYPVYLDPTGETNLAYDVQSIPVFVLIKDGKIIWQSRGFAKGDIAYNVENAMG